MYYRRPMKLEDLDGDEKLALGGLLRMMVRSDGDFSEKEENAINAAGERLGGRLWGVISQSAQDCPNDADIRAAVAKVTRAEARALIRGVVAEIAESDLVSESEHQLLGWLDESWA